MIGTEISASVTPEVLQELGLYDRAIVEVADELGVIDGQQTPDRCVAAPTPLWSAVCRRLEIANPPDVRSSFAGGRRAIPGIVQTNTPEGLLWHLEYVDGGWQFHLRAPDLDPFEPDDAFLEIEIDDLTPAPLMRDITSWDEQVVLRVVGDNNLYGMLGLRHFLVQAHKRTTVDGSQIEVDGLGIALAGFAIPQGMMSEPVGPGEKIVTAEEVKMPHEPFTVLQLQRAARYAQQAYPGHKVLPVAIRPHGIVIAGSPLKAIDMVTFAWDRDARTIGPPTMRARFHLQ